MLIKGDIRFLPSYCCIVCRLFHAYLVRSIVISCDDNLNCLSAILYFFSVIKSRYFSISKSCLYCAYISSQFQLLIAEYHDCLYVSHRHCFIKLKRISV